MCSTAFIFSLMLCLLAIAQPNVTATETPIVYYHKLFEWATDIGDISVMAWSLDGQRLAVGSFNGTLEIRNAANGHTLQTIEVGGGPVSSVDWRPDGSSTLMTGGSDGEIRLWDTQTGEQICHFIAHGRTLNPGEGNPNGVTVAKWSPNGEMIASGGDDGIALLWDMGSKAQCKRLQRLEFSNANLFGVLGIDWNPTSDRLFSLGLFNILPIWDAKTGEQISNIPCPFLYSDQNPCRFFKADWSPDGKSIVASGENGAASFSRIWDVSTSASRDLLSLCTINLRWMPKGRGLMGWCEGQLEMWDAKTLQLIGETDQLPEYESQYNPYIADAVSPDEQRIAISYHPDATTAIQIWGVSPSGSS